MPKQKYYDEGYDDGYDAGFIDGVYKIEQDLAMQEGSRTARGRAYQRGRFHEYRLPSKRRSKGKRSTRKISDWQKFIKANSKKKAFKYRDGKLNLKKMGVAYRKTRAYKKNQKKRR